MKKLLKYVALALIAGILLYGFDAFAAGDGIFARAANILKTTFKNVRMIVYVLGAFGLIGIACAAILGKVPFKWLAMLAIGLAIVAAADGVINYAIHSNNMAEDYTGIGETGYELN